MIPHISFGASAPWGRKITVDSDLHTPDQIAESIEYVADEFSGDDADACPAIKEGTVVNIGKSPNGGQMFAVSEIRDGERVGIALGEVSRATHLDSILERVTDFFKQVCSRRR